MDREEVFQIARILNSLNKARTNLRIIQDKFPPAIVPHLEGIDALQASIQILSDQWDTFVRTVGTDVIEAIREIADMLAIIDLMVEDAALAQIPQDDNICMRRAAIADDISCILARNENVLLRIYAFTQNRHDDAFSLHPTTSLETVLSTPHLTRAAIEQMDDGTRTALFEEITAYIASPAMRPLSRCTTCDGVIYDTELSPHCSYCGEPNVTFNERAFEETHSMPLEDARLIECGSGHTAHQMCLQGRIDIFIALGGDEDEILIPVNEEENIDVDENEIVSATLAYFIIRHFYGNTLAAFHASGGKTVQGLSDYGRYCLLCGGLVTTDSDTL